MKASARKPSSGLKDQSPVKKDTGFKKVSQHLNCPLLVRWEDSSTNVMVWKKCLGDLLQEKYGDLGKFTINGGTYWVPDEIEHDEDDLGDEADPQGFHLDDIKEERRNCLRHMAEMKKNRDC